MKEIKLFDYQEDMKERIEKALRLHRSVMAQMPTGTGKTVLLASVVESFLREHSNCHVWIVAHRRELVSQIRETIERVFSKTHPSSLTLKGGSTAFPKPLSPQGTGDVTAPPRCSEPLRSKDGGPSKVSPDCLSASALKGASKFSPDCAGWDRLDATCLRPGATSASSVNLASDMMPIKAVSIQWLSKHYAEIEEEPGMIVIDEAHHALAKTYKEMWERFPNAKFLGLTATPCRLNGKGFTDLFDVLVQSWGVPEFISKGRLATYDFVSIKSDGVTQRLIDSLQKRGADGDYQNKEMDMLLNKKPSIERLYRSLEEFGKDRKGIVYAINISHANAIAEFYREHGIAAVAIDSKTPSSLRKELIERFKTSSFSSFSNHPVKFSKITPSLFTIKEGDFSNHPVPLSKEGSTFSPSPSSSGSGDVTAPPRRSEPLRSKDGGPSKVSPDCLCGVNRLGDGLGDRLGATCLRAADGVADGLAPIQVLVNVDIFSEGFDCPDVEFVQLARPTLSLAKYLQMVGRGLRVAKGKKNCVIIDNVGLYRVFGLPSQVWNWKATFEGKVKIGKKKETPKEREFFLMYGKQETMPVDQDSEMMMVMSHEELMQSLKYREFVDCNDDFAIVKLPDGKMTVVNRQGEQVIEPGNYYEMKFLQGNILSYRPRRKTVCYYDLLARVVIDEDIHEKDVPKVITINKWEFVEYNGLFRSRTYEYFGLPFRPSQYDLWNCGYYLIYNFQRSTTSGCQVWVYNEKDAGSMRMYKENSEKACFLRGDHTHVYWLCADLYESGIVVMDSHEDYYFVDSNLKKTYIGCNHPKTESENLMVAMPRLGKQVYDMEMKRRKKQEEQELLLLHEKSEAGNVELYQAGKKWGVKVDGKVIVPPLYHSIAQPVGAYCAFEEIPRHWGVMTLKGKVIVDAKYEKVEIRNNGIAVVTGITGKTQTIKLLKVKE
ncbi:DEAD/DEAH box helicase family protein [Segatella copri]|uniref:DEAD/DEAH box helicase family protein n=1 Tax=Segatella copri TaxID=165179 RepID=UPI00294ADC10|nr:DEAD/DEAH box helicase family protein [Segatella copri]WOG32195.1 DEAD/DEAH box helicase family protein [Segatella copri]